MSWSPADVGVCVPPRPERPWSPCPGPLPMLVYVSPRPEHPRSPCPGPCRCWCMYHLSLSAPGLCAPRMWRRGLTSAPAVCPPAVGPGDGVIPTVAAAGRRRVIGASLSGAGALSVRYVSRGAGRGAGERSPAAERPYPGSFSMPARGHPPLPTGSGDGKGVRSSSLLIMTE